MAPGLAASLRNCLEEVSDPRSAHARRHPLTSVLFLALTAVIGGADTWVEVEEFGRDHRAWFERWLHLPHGIPSHDTFGRVFALLDPEPREAGFARWVQTLHDQLTGQVVALDGKTARRSHDRSHGRSALHTVSAYAGESRLVLAQTAVAAQSNEITAVPEVLALLDLAGATVTLDALGCQKELARHIRSQQADYVLTVKENQPMLRAALEETFSVEREAQFEGCPHTAHRTVNGGHGRIEIRRGWAVGDPEYLQYVDPEGHWPDLHSLLLVEAERRVEGRVSTETRYFISSHPPEARHLLATVRAHWGIENSLHWVLDVAFREDESRVRTGHAPRNLGLLRRRALNLLRQDTTVQAGVAIRRRKAGRNLAYMEQVLGLA